MIKVQGLTKKFGTFTALDDFSMNVEKGSIYVGGITYTAELEGLEPGQSQKLTANHFAAGSSEVVMVRTYED